ncbi:MAG: ABC transporter permease subunit [Anaerolineae bacterium]
MKQGRLRLCAIAAVMVVVALLATSCGAGQPQTIKIGIVMPITGPNAATTRDHINGMMVAIDDVNNAGGLLGGRKIEVIKEDDRSQPSEVIRTLPHWYLLAFALVVLTVIVMFRISRSRIGLDLIALREDEIAARAMGVNTYKMKVLAFTVSSLIAGLAGSIYAHYINSIDPYSFMIGLSATVLVMVLAGGVGSIVGSILSAVGLTLLPEFLRQFTSAGLRMVLFGAALVAIILFMPEGFAGVARQIRERRWKRGKPLPEEGAVAEAAGAAVPPSRTLEAEHE